MSGSGITRKERQQLTALAIERLKPEAAPYRVKDTRAVGLALRVAPDGGKTWDLAYRIAKSTKVKRQSLGRYPGASLEDARRRAAELTGAARQGRDLIAEERQARETRARAITIEKLIALYLARRVRGRLRSAPVMERILERVLAPLSAMPAADVRKRDLLPLFESIAAIGHARAAGRARQIVSGMFKWAVSLDIVPSNPAQGLPAYSHGEPRDRTLSEQEIRTLWAWLESSSLAGATADALRVQLLIGARISEVVGMTAAEIDRDKWIWTLPASRSKNARPRTTPLVGLARAIIAARIEAADGGPLFPSATGAPLTASSIGVALNSRRSRLPIAAFTSHDLRRTVASTMDSIGVSRDVIGELVGHSSGDDKSSRTLFRHYLKDKLIERKTSALKVWDAWLKAIIADEAQAKVVQLHGAQSRRG
jgi:integrase